ncbi:hypothetical protein G7Z17_g13031 [Cylindrodendrum hubeiense]|uniref:Spo12-like protein n=1 Tax=Cylindrodendrum hubeiense TaxID=595255 RepID=A0A9P5L4Y7_9HYPO|nr:hypothetical protein G7Z17_g13031 [Cylindrodendrum hubeiense]
MSAKVLADKDANASMADHQVFSKDVKSMEYHRQVLQSKMADDDTYVQPAEMRCDKPSITNGNRKQPPLTLCDRTNKYISPSDNIMSPCTAKINALRNKHASKVKPKSLFAQASAKKLQGENPLGTTPAAPAKVFQL